MKTNNNYEISDSLWGRATQYASVVWKSWGKDVDEYINERRDTDDRSKDEHSASTLWQHLGHDAGLVTHLVGSVFSNDYTKERVKELEDLISSTDSYQSTKEQLNKLEHTLDQASQQFMQEHPKVQTAFMASKERLEAIKTEVSKEAEAFVKNHPEITNDVKALAEIGMVLPAAKVGKIALETKELNALNKLDYAHDQGKALAKGIPSEIDKKTLNLEELAVTAEGNIGKESLFDVNQKARANPHPETPALRHDYIRKKEAKNIAKVEKDMIKAEQIGEPWTEAETEKAFYRASKPNATLAQSHAETAIIQKAYEQGLTQDGHMFIKVNGKEVCGHCNSDTIAMAEKAGLKSITIHDYNAIDKKNPEKPVLHWNQETGRKRYASFEDLEEKFKDIPKAPDHIKHAGILEAERTQMNSMDYTLLGAGGTALLHDNIPNIQTEFSDTPETNYTQPTHNHGTSSILPHGTAVSNEDIADFAREAPAYHPFDGTHPETDQAMDAYANNPAENPGVVFTETGIILPSSATTYTDAEEVEEATNINTQNMDDYGMER